MRSIVAGLCIALMIGGGLWAQNSRKPQKTSTVNSPVTTAIDNGAKWLASVQGADGGWGQDGGETSYIRASEHLESNGNDVANTAVAALALLQAGKQYQANVHRAIDFILARVEASPVDGLAVTDARGTQIQRKLGPYIDTFLTSMLLAKVDGTLSKPTENARVRRALEKCVAKIERNQKGDGSWNVAGGWAPVLGTSLASRSLYEAQQKGVQVADSVMAKAETYTVNAIRAAPPAGVGASSASGGGIRSGVAGGVYAAAAPPESAGVGLYQSAQALEQLSRTEADRKKNAKVIQGIQGQLADTRFVDGFGSIGGEEFFSYLNIGDGLKRAGGDQWTKWHSQMTKKILSLQNSDGTWAGHHCITGRVAVTSAAILNLAVDREN
jgi:Squalene-hopene cyclase C-terminal domain